MRLAYSVIQDFDWVLVSRVVYILQIDFVQKNFLLKGLYMNIKRDFRKFKLLPENRNSKISISIDFLKDESFSEKTNIFVHHRIVIDINCQWPTVRAINNTSGHTYFREKYFMVQPLGATAWCNRLVPLFRTAKVFFAILIIFVNSIL